MTATPRVTTVEELIRHRLSTALGGVRGSIETTVPLLAFVLTWTVTTDARLSLGAAAVATLAFLIARLVQRQTVQFVLSAVFATAIAAFFALRSGRAEDAFLPGILTGAAYAVVTVISVLTRWPVVGFMVGAADPAVKEGDPFRWRRNPAAVAVCSRLTLVLTAMFLIRLAIMGPLYLTNNVAGLAVGRVVLGWPLWAAAVAVMGLMLVRGHTPIDPDDELVRAHQPEHDAQLD